MPSTAPLEIVKERLPQRPVVVVSAMAKVTDQLLNMARAAGAGDRDTALKLLSANCRSAITILPENYWGLALFTQFPQRSRGEFESLDELLRGIVRRRRIDAAHYRPVAAYGEILSSNAGDSGIVCAGSASVWSILATASLPTPPIPGPRRCLRKPMPRLQTKVSATCRRNAFQ